MATSNHERIGKALELLNEGLLPFFERELHAALGDSWQTQLSSSPDDKLFGTSRQERSSTGTRTESFRLCGANGIACSVRSLATRNERLSVSFEIGRAH